jgi:hypothetical protein
VLSKPDFRFVLLPLVLTAGVANAQDDASALLERVEAEDCGPFADATPETLQGRLETNEDNALASLVIDAVARQCAALGAIPAPERPGEDSTRSATEGIETSEADRLAAEARYLVETAMQIDPDAANDLLRRLLGPRPGEDG